MKCTSIVTVLGVRRYSFPDENDAKRIVEGCKVDYVDEWDTVEQQNARGIIINTASMPYEAFPMFQAVPGEYDVLFESRKGQKGEMILVPQSFDFVQPFEPFKMATTPKPQNDEQGKAKQ